MFAIFGLGWAELLVLSLCGLIHILAVATIFLASLVCRMDCRRGGGVVERDRLEFEFAADQRIVKISASQLRRRLVKEEPIKT